MAAVDVAGYVSGLKDHAVGHGFHIHDERHFVETYSLGQTWHVIFHPEEACGGPLELFMALEIDPRVLLSFEDGLIAADGDIEELPNAFELPLIFTWDLPPLSKPPDLLILATELAGVGGPELPLEVSAIDSYASVTDAPERRLSITSRSTVSLHDVYMLEQPPCEIFDACRTVSLYLVELAPDWMG